MTPFDSFTTIYKLELILEYNNIFKGETESRKTVITDT